MKYFGLKSLWFTQTRYRTPELVTVVIVFLILIGKLTSSADTHYVNVSNSTPIAPFTSWETATTNIQEAVDVASEGDTVLVAEGTYDTGGMIFHEGLTNRIAITAAIRVSSVAGPTNTFIVGQGPLGDAAVRCAYVGTNAVLDGFTLTNGHTRSTGDWVTERSGGGAWCELSAILTNCVISGNSAFARGGGAYVGTFNNCTLTGNSADDGGGAYLGTLNDCVLTGNSAEDEGGGACGGTLNQCVLTGNTANRGGGVAEGALNNCVLADNCAGFGGGVAGATLTSCRLTGNTAGVRGGGATGGTLNNCTLTGNSAEKGGGVYSGRLTNCIVYFNEAINEANIDPNYAVSDLQYCCTTPLPEKGAGNIDEDPLLADLSHLSVNSPCIGAGTNVFATGTDIDGEAWLDPPSIGCDEYISSSATGMLFVSISG